MYVIIITINDYYYCGWYHMLGLTRGFLFTRKGESLNLMQSGIWKDFCAQEPEEKLRASSTGHFLLSTLSVVELLPLHICSGYLSAGHASLHWPLECELWPSLYLVFLLLVFSHSQLGGTFPGCSPTTGWLFSMKFVHYQLRCQGWRDGVLWCVSQGVAERMCLKIVGTCRQLWRLLAQRVKVTFSYHFLVN